MRPDFFRTQWDRLVIRFGARAMDDEFKRLCAMEVNTMSEAGFKRAVDVWIGSRTSNKPPLLSEFREARLNEEKLKFKNDLQGATNFIFGKSSPPEMRAHLKNILNREYGGDIDTPMQALEVARLRLLRGNGPDGVA